MIDFSKVIEIIQSLTSSVAGLAIPLGGLAAVICGLIWIFSSDQQSVTKAKSWLIRIVVGLLIVGLAGGVVDSIAKAAGIGG